MFASYQVKMVYVASLNDQVVPIYSGVFTCLSHPLVLRSLYIDGDAYQYVHLIWSDPGFAEWTLPLSQVLLIFYPISSSSYFESATRVCPTEAYWPTFLKQLQGHWVESAILPFTRNLQPTRKLKNEYFEINLISTVMAQAGCWLSLSRERWAIFTRWYWFWTLQRKRRSQRLWCELLRSWYFFLSIKILPEDPMEPPWFVSRWTGCVSLL